MNKKTTSQEKEISTKEIVQIGSKVLRRVSKSVSIDSITGSVIQNIITNMHMTLSATSNGVALAAPQIGENVRIFIISPKAFENPDDEHLVYINPEIIKLSKKKVPMEEGCLSVRGIYGLTQRHRQATVRAYDENGQQFERGGSGLLAQIFQHEIDHLDGILFNEHARDLREENQ